LTAEYYGKINKNHRAFVGFAQQKPGFSPNLRAATKYFRKSIFVKNPVSFLLVCTRSLQLASIVAD